MRNVEAADLDEVLALNNAAVPAVNQLTLAELTWFAEAAVVFGIADGAEGVDGFLIGLGPGVDYDSHNYRWFSERYDAFVYVDRIVISPTAWGQGLARSFYDDFCRLGRIDGATHLLAEVNTFPRNERSLVFHERYGFETLAERGAPDGSKQVAMLARRL